MKKGHFIPLVAVLIFLMTAWTASAADDGGEAFEYFPLKAQNYWAYKVSLPDNKAYSQIVLVNSSVGQDIRAVVFINQIPQMEVVYKLNEQGLFRTKQISAEGVITLNPMQLVLASKLNPGSVWSWEAADTKGKETAKVVGFEKVTVPVGTFEALLLEYEGVYNDGTVYFEKTWFVKGVGYVKVVSTAGDMTITKELLEYKVN